MTTIAEVQQMPRTERANRLASITMLAQLGPAACFPAEEALWLLKEIADQSAEIERLREQLALWQRGTQGHVWIRNEEYSELCALARDAKHGNEVQK